MVCKLCLKAVNHPSEIVSMLPIPCYIKCGGHIPYHKTSPFLPRHPETVNTALSTATCSCSGQGFCSALLAWALSSLFPVPGVFSGPSLTRRAESLPCSHGPSQTSPRWIWRHMTWCSSPLSCGSCNSLGFPCPRQHC